MKVLMLGWELPPHNSGGLGVACLNLAKRLAASGTDIEFVVPYSADYGIDFMKVTSTSQTVEEPEYLTAYNSRLESNLSLSEENYIKEVSSLVEDRSFDIIHAHDWLTFRAALQAKEKTGWPLIVHVHSVESDRAGGKGNRLVAEIEQTTFMLADRIVAVSDYTKQKIAKDYQVPAEKIEVVHNSLDLDDLEPLDLSNAYFYLDFLKKRGYKVVCNLGRQTLQKGLPNLLLAAKQVIKYQPKTMFLLVGNGEQQHELINQAAELSISRNVIFAGFQRGKAARDAFAIADLFVMPSISEPFGLTPLESIAYGTPTLISNQSGVAEVLYNTLKVDFWDVDGLANQIISALKSRTLLTSLQVNAFKELHGLTWQRTADQFIKIYNSSQAAA